MIVSESIYGKDGQPLGRMQQDLDAGTVRFQPVEEHKRLEEKTWRTTRDCVRDVLRAYAEPR